MKKIDKRMILPLLHFLASFVWERFVLIPKDRASVAFSIPMNSYFSDTFEECMSYAISKIMAGIIIFVLWGILFAVIDKKIKKETVIVFSLILAAATFVTVIKWPDVFEAGGDNYIPYSYAIRLMPEYWHSIYLSCLYTASFMVFPHAVSINLLLMISFVLTLGYIYNRILESPVFANVKWIRFLLFAVFVFRDTYTVMTNPERAEYNVSFTLLFIAIVLFDMLEKKKRKLTEYLLLMSFASFLAVFRSEGIIIAIPLFLIMSVYVYRPKISKLALVFAGLFIALLLFKIPPKVGEIKYYGSDYSIINSFNSLYNVFNSEDANLDYEGSEEDLAAIEEITPVEVIKEFASDGYRRYNYANGRIDINQSMAGKEKSDAYSKAYKNIIKHNIPIYLFTQYRMFMQAIKASQKPYLLDYHGEGTNLEGFGSELWETGRVDIQAVPGVFRWQRIGIRNFFSKIITGIQKNYFDFVTKTKIYTAFLILEFIIGLVVIVHGIAGLIKKNWKPVSTGLVSLVLTGYVAALALVMPVGANMYFHAYIYCMFVTEIILPDSRCSYIPL